MKNKILAYIICVLTGMILATLGWYICLKLVNVNQRNKNMNMMNQENFVQRVPQGGFNGETPPAKPGI